MLRIPCLAVLVLSFSLFCMVSVLRADTINFVGPNGGTLTGGFVYDATTNTFVSWNITVSAGQDSGGNQFSALTYSNTIAGDTAGPGGFNGATFYDFSFFSPTGGNGTPPFNARTLSLVVPGVSDSSISGVPAPGQTSQIQLVTFDSPLAASADCGVGIPPVGAIPCGAEGQALGGRALQGPAFLTITDPPGTDVTYGFTFTNVPSGGGGGTGVPEPSTLLLSSLGFAALALKRFYA
jgi:hypothetical protein